MDGPTLADGVPLNLDRWDRDDHIRTPPTPTGDWRIFAAELATTLTPNRSAATKTRIDPDPRTECLQRLYGALTAPS